MTDAFDPHGGYPPGAGGYPPGAHGAMELTVKEGGAVVLSDESVSVRSTSSTRSGRSRTPRSSSRSWTSA